MPSPAHKVFAVGRIDKRGRRIIFVNEPARAPFPGPWDLRAVLTVVTGLAASR